MVELDKKYVFHIPLYKYADGDLVRIDIGDAFDELTRLLEGYNFYTVHAEGHYKSRSFDELLLILFATDFEKPEEIFVRWFRDNNDVLEQEALAYECGNAMFIENLD